MCDYSNEEWRDIEGHEGYQASSEGRIRRIPIRSGCEPKILSPRIGTSGRLIVKLNRPKDTLVALDKIVASVFIPKEDGKCCVLHVNGDLSDCRASNLKWATFDEVVDVMTPIIRQQYDDDFWADIPGYENLYQISRNGDARSIDRVIAFKDTYSIRKGLMLSKHYNSGDACYALCMNNQVKLYPVDVLVALAFLNYDKDNDIILHTNGNVDDCRCDNLLIVTCDEYKTMMHLTRDDVIERLSEPGEEWRDISGYENLYLVSDRGRVLSLPRCRTSNARTTIDDGYIMSPVVNERGYRRIGLCKDGKVAYFYVHRLVAEAFIPRQEGRDYVNHLDEVPGHDFASNLEWVTHRENNVYGTVIARREARLDHKAIGKKIRKPVLQFDLDGSLIRCWSGMCEIEEMLGINHSLISQACNRKKSHRDGIVFGYWWCFEEDYGCVA